MAKKNNETIVIKDEPLMPTTIGVYSNKKKGGAVVFIVLVLFLAIAYFLPNINKYLNPEKDEPVQYVPDNPNPNPDPKLPDNPDTPTETEKFAIAEGTIIDKGDYKISNISNNGKNLTVTIDAIKSCNFTDMYFELYDSENVLLGRTIIGSISLSSGASQVLNLKSYEGASKISIVKKTINDLPQVNLAYNDMKEATLTCVNDSNERYEYKFKEDMLQGFTYNFTRPYSTELSYVEDLSRYQGYANTYNGNQGIVVSINTSENGFVYVVTVDLTTIAPEKVPNLLSYKKDALAKEVSFKTSANGFTCQSN